MANEVSRPAVKSVRQVEPLENLIETVWPGVFSPFITRQSTQPQIAHIDVLDHDDAFVLKAEIAGVDKDKLDVQVHGNQVYISGVKEEDRSREEGTYIYQERRYGEFSRTVQLPADVNGDQTKAIYKDGVLELTLPKTESAKRKKVAIS
ncbi:Hsp20/alpha crystallin family protein [Acidithiobacillus sp.]|uniref:Hsp20/alpha crystallin family protein n=1 Tax=Acidithiobacillus sp. TaxID=1872118 RepID=UPI00258C66CA|nr:Hsp20/alpha crystallin family protein [Acidithiobacillus sp.]MDD5375128.1 Hsp20/alpha crystallin family protein [Acidithiobacillus sp.]